jgi:predicted aspartyl protease
MKFLVPWFVFAVLLSQPRSSQAQHVFEMGLKGTSGTIPFRLDNGFLILVEGRIGTQSNLRFLLDTGASISIVDNRIADKLALVRRAHESFTLNFNQRLDWEEATFPEVSFGPVLAANVRMLVGRLAAYSEFARNVDAVIGMDLLKLSNFIIDYDAREIIFYANAKERSVDEKAPISGCVMIEVLIQGRPVRLIVDTGIQGMLLYEERLLARVPRLRMEGKIRNVTLGGRLEATQIALPDVVFGRRNGEVVVLMMKAPPPETLSGVDGFVGLAPLKARRVNFDFAGRTLSWD